MKNKNNTYTTIIDEWLPAAVFLSHDEEYVVRARIVLSMIVFCALSVSIASFMMLSVSLLLIRNLWVGAFFSAYVSISLCVLFVYFRRRVNIVATANGFASIIFISIAAAVITTGGFTSPVTLMLLSVPVIIFLVAGRKSGLIWSTITLFFYWTIFLLYKHGTEFVQVMHAENREYVTTGLWYLSGFIIMGCLALYDRIVSGLTSALHQEKLTYHDEAVFDVITGFYNRDSFQKKFEEDLDVVAQSGGRLALLRFDIKNIDAIISQLDYESGDEFIAAVARACQRALGDNGYLGRFGGCEFSVLIPQIKDRGEIISLIYRLRKIFSGQIRVAGDIHLPLIAFIGGVLSPDYSINPRSLMRGAQDAMIECESINEKFVLR